MIMFIPINYTKANFQQIMKVFYKNDFKSYLDGQKEKNLWHMSNAVAKDYFEGEVRYFLISSRKRVSSWSCF